MATEFKRLSDVNIIESMSNSTNVLIEENGEIVKMSGNKMIPTGVVKSVNGVTPDEAGNVVMSGLPEGATAYQQLVTDSEGNAKWEDRLGYKMEPVETEILNEPNLAFTVAGEMTQAALVDNMLPMVIGQTYKVIWNGNEYSSTCRTFEVGGGMIAYLIGNASGIGLEDTGEPFLFMENAGRQAVIDYAAAAQNSVRVIAFVQETIPVPSDLLPVATDDAYGVVKKTEVIERYYFPSYEAPANEMREAIAKFQEGKGIINWAGSMVVYASDSNVDGIIYLMFGGDTFLRKFSVHSDGGNERYIVTIWELTDPASLYLSTSDGVYALYIDNDGNVKANKRITS